MVKFIISCLFVGVIFLTGVSYGSSLSERNASSQLVEKESMESAFEHWKGEQEEVQQVKEIRNAENRAYDQHTEDNVYSAAAGFISDKLKSVSRAIVFHFLAAFEDVIHSNS